MVASFGTIMESKKLGEDWGALQLIMYLEERALAWTGE